MTKNGYSMIGDEPPGYNEIVNRNQFIRKVYTILYIQLLITVGMCALFVSVDSIKEYVRGPNGEALYISALVMQFVLMLVLVCTNLHRKKPHNMIILVLFTLFLSYTLGVLSTYYDTNILLYAGGITFMVTLGLTLFAFQTRYDFTGLGPYLFSFLLILLAMGIMSIFIKSDIYNLLYASLGALVFSFYLVFDTQMIIGGKHKYEYDQEDYIFAAMNLYLDIINMFLYILEILDYFRR